MQRLRILLPCAVVALFLAEASHAAGDGKYRSHPPMRPLHAPSDRPMQPGPALFVDPVKGDDRGDGSQAKPWKSLRHAVKQLKPGDTLYLRGGIYSEHVTMTASGTADKPITIRAYPKEVVVIDGGLREFYETPEKAWEPAPGGAEGEFRSIKAYPDLGSAGNQTHLLGNFGDSMVPLHGYKYLSDLRSTNVYWNLPVNTGPEGNIYCGPGICHDLTTGRIHVRLAHTKMKYLSADDNYAGETDPRKLPLVIAGHQGGAPLSFRGVRHVRVQDILVRGSRGPTIEVVAAEDIEFDGLTVYGGSTCFAVKDSVGVRLINTACRGIAAPWTFRGSLKYRAIEARLFSASGWEPTGQDNRDFEFAYCEFTDCVDGVFIGNVRNVRFHHNLLDNVTDDGIFLTATTGYDGVTPGGDVHIYQNRIARCLTSLAFGVGHGRQKVLPERVQTGAGVHVYRNVFDFRRPVWYHQPTGPNVPQTVTSKGRFAGDHGSPAWEPMNIYHNTLLADDVPRYTYGTWGLGNAMGKGTRRRVFNNIVAQLEAVPGNIFPQPTTDFQADGNLLWSYVQGPKVQDNLFAKYRASKAFADSKVKYPPGWGANDRIADPMFVTMNADWKNEVDLGLRKGSPTIDAGIVLPKAWPDPLRADDAGKPDIGALPVGAKPWRVGVRGRMTMFGTESKLDNMPSLPVFEYTPRPRVGSKRKPAAIVEGYPAFDVPLLAFALRKQNANVEILKHAWLPPKDFDAYSAIILNGNLLRAKVKPSQYSPDDLKTVDAFMRKGGTLILTLSGREAFRTPHGRDYLAKLTGQAAPAKNAKPRVLMPDHPWLKHLDAKNADAWLAAMTKQSDAALAAKNGENILGAPEGNTLLYQQRVGKGRFIYIGWQIHDALPRTRDKASSLQMERDFEEQMGVLFNIAAELFP